MVVWKRRMRLLFLVLWALQGAAGVRVYPGRLPARIERCGIRFPSSTLTLHHPKADELFLETAKASQLQATADSVGCQQSTGKGTSLVPSAVELIRFGLPTLGIWLLQPILSLIDTAVVGISPSYSLSQLASLGPGISWSDSTSYLFNFIAIATTNLFANALRDGEEERFKAPTPPLHNR